MNAVSKQILSALRSAGIRGLRINDIATSLEIDLATATNAIYEMIKEKQVMEKSDANETRYILQGAMGDEAEQGTLGDLNGCPCYHCLKISRCGVRQPDSPVSCRNLETWMVTSDTS
jgi:hypothetical protein